MANNLIPEELQALIDQYLTDGVLTLLRWRKGH